MSSENTMAITQRIEEAVDRAKDAFWQQIATSFPEVTSGDFAPDAQENLTTTMTAAVSTWVEGNLPSHTDPVKEAFELLNEFVGHTGHYGAYPEAHSGAYRDSANAAVVLASALRNSPPFSASASVPPVEVMDALQKLLPHVQHFATFRQAHPDVHKQAARASALITNVQYQMESDARAEALPRLHQQAGAPYTLGLMAAKALQGASGDAKAVNWDQVHQDVFAKAVGQDKQPVATVLEAIKQHSPGAVTPQQIAAIEAMGESAKVEHKTSNLVVDGTDEYGNFTGSIPGATAPFVVFDIDKQENIAGPYSTREDAEHSLVQIQNGGPHHLDADALLAYARARESRPPEWTQAQRLAANMEGWDIFDYGDGQSRICKIDYPEEWMEEKNIPSVPELSDDTVAWEMVFSGNLPHHLAALAFMKHHNPDEVAHVEAFLADQVVAHALRNFIELLNDPSSADRAHDPVAADRQVAVATKVLKDLEPSKAHAPVKAQTASRRGPAPSQSNDGPSI